MTDPCEPKLSSFTYSVLEMQAVSWALGHDNPWGVDSLPKKSLSPQEKIYSNTIKKLKKRIKKFHLKRHDKCCCYCAQNLKGRVIEQDREHIIPKGGHPSLTFSISNLAVACKTCNMSVKGTNTSHLTGYRHGGLREPSSILNPKNYNIPHPNIDSWDKHLSFTSSQTDKTVTACHYHTKTRKGRFAYYFFKLYDLEIFTNTEEQRRIKSNQPLHPKLLDLRDKFGQ